MISVECFGSSSAGNCYRLKSNVNGDEIILDAGVYPLKVFKEHVGTIFCIYLAF